MCLKRGNLPMMPEQDCKHMPVPNGCDERGKP